MFMSIDRAFLLIEVYLKKQSHKCGINICGENMTTISTSISKGNVKLCSSFIKRNSRQALQKCDITEYIDGKIDQYITASEKIT